MAGDCGVVGDGMVGRRCTRRRETSVFFGDGGHACVVWPWNEDRGVRALIVVMKRGNSRGAKGCRKVDCGKLAQTGNAGDDRRVSAGNG